MVSNLLGIERDNNNASPSKCGRVQQIHGGGGGGGWTRPICSFHCTGQN